MRNDKLEKFINVVIENGYYSSKKRLLFKLTEFFNTTELKNKKVLDIGGGYGLLSFYAAVMGADSVLCLEPECEGSSDGVQKTFTLIKNMLEVDYVFLSTDLFQDIKTDRHYDLIILHNSINHLNEKACVDLSKNESHMNEYIGYFSKMNKLLSVDGGIILSDCSRFNFWNHVGLKNPFWPTIEWTKHQSPFMWKKLLHKSGYEVKKIKWSSFNRLGSLGKLFTGNIVASYFLTSHFTIYAEKKVI